MKYLMRENGTFLEAEMMPGGLVAKTSRVNPKSLVHFGTDIKTLNRTNPILDREYVQRMETLGADYLFISLFPEDVEFAQEGKRLIAVTAYRVKS
jgi:hypothetical protein